MGVHAGCAALPGIVYRPVGETLKEMRQPRFTGMPLVSLSLDLRGAICPCLYLWQELQQGTPLAFAATFMGAAFQLMQLDIAAAGMIATEAAARGIAS